jgi:hypothetical protein
MEGYVGAVIQKVRGITEERRGREIRREDEVKLR